MRALCLPLVAVSLGFLVLRGGRQWFAFAPLSPVFTSTPVTAASQGVSYQLYVAATDPAWRNGDLLAVTEPAGSTLQLASTINWTPTAAESRVSNSL